LIIISPHLPNQKNNQNAQQMKPKTTLLPIAFFLFLSLPLSARNTHQGFLSAKIDTLGQVNDSLLHFRMVLDVKGKAVEARRSRLYIPALVADSQSMMFSPILINGSKRQKLYKRVQVLQHQNNDSLYYQILVARKDSTYHIHYDLTIPYKAWMDTADVCLSVQDAGCADCYRSEELILASSLRKSEPEIPDIYFPNPKVNFVVPAEEEIKKRSAAGKAYLEFATKQAAILPNYRNNQRELKKIYQTLDRIIKNPDAQVTGISVLGFASPEGLSQTNLTLSAQRATALKVHLKSLYPLDKVFFTADGGGEDWDGLKTLLDSSRLAQKTNLRKIIDTTPLEQGRKTKLMKFGKGLPYKEMQKTLFPLLRKVNYDIEFTIRKYTLEETKEIVNTSPEQLSSSEWYNLAKSYGENSEPYEKTMALILKYYPDNAAANINEAAVLLKRGEFEPARKRLEKMASDPLSFNNLGVYYLKTGDLAKAQEFLLKARSYGVPEAEHNLSELRILLKREQKLAQLKAAGKR
jgi:outer membrane protein OmpA-like peptidoglycan-associated protein